MTSAIKTATAAKVLFLASLALNHSGCALTPEQQSASFDTSTVEKIRFEFQQPPAIFVDGLPLQNISRQVSENLAGWSYQVSEQEKNPSHLMTVSIKKQTRSSTPVGFSFSSGNSDPRALDFQKATVLPISCYLSPVAQPQHRAELTLEVMADDYLNLDKSPKPLKKTVELLTDDLSTACYNLLSSLKINKKQLAPVKGKMVNPEWIPAIRIEVENTGNKHATDDTPATQFTPNSREPRKRIIIHNEGSPVIFTFGHERK